MYFFVLSVFVICVLLLSTTKELVVQVSTALSAKKLVLSVFIFMALPGLNRLKLGTIFHINVVFGVFDLNARRSS